MLELNVLDKIAQTSSKNEKLEILKQYSSNSNLCELLSAVFDFQRRFFISKVNMPPAISVSGVSHADFMALLLALETRAITGNLAKKEVEDLFAKCNEQQQHWYIRVLRKDLKAGFSDETAVKAGYPNIPIFDVMLAKDGKECKNLTSIVSKGVYVSPKFDGYRCLAIVDNGDVVLHSRNGIPYENFPTIISSLQRSFPTGQYVFDGEIMSDDFQSIQKSAFASKRGTTVGDPKFYIFGYISFDEWTTSNFIQTTKQRLSCLTELAKNFNDDLILVDHRLVNNAKEILDLEAEYIAKGFEGAIALPDIPYYLGKKTNRLMKFKTFQSWDCEIVGFYEGKEDTRHFGRLGGFIVKQENGLLCRGAGELSDEDRDYIWQNQSKFLGRIAEFSYQNLTDDGIMRFPQFRRWRSEVGSRKI